MVRASLLYGYRCLAIPSGQTIENLHLSFCPVCKIIHMRTIFYVNGKRVDASTYFAADSENYRRKKLWEACISYYENHPYEFMIATMGTTEATLPMFLMSEYEKTEDYKEQVKKIDTMVQRYEDNQLITIAIAFVAIISLSLMIICCQ